MRRPRAWITAGSGALAVAVLCAAGYAARDRLLELYYLPRLRAAATPEERLRTVRRLGELRSRKALPHLRLLAKGEPPLRDEAVLAVLRCGPPAWTDLAATLEAVGPASVLEWLLRLEAGDSSGEGLRQVAAELTLRSTEEPPRMTPAILAVTHDLENRVLLEVLREGRGPLPPREPSSSYSRKVRLRALFILKLRIAYPGAASSQVAGPVVPALAAALRDEDPEVSLSALEFLEAIGSAAREAVPAVLEVLAATERSERAWEAAGIGALASLGLEAGHARAVADTALRAPNHAVGASLVGLLLAFEATAAEGLAALAETAGSPDPGLRLKVIELLDRIGAQSGKAAPILLQGLRDKDSKVRAAAIRALGKLDVPGTPRLPRLAAPAPEGRETGGLCAPPGSPSIP